MDKSNLVIKVPENEFKALIDRSKVVSDVKEHLSPWTALINDITNYGTNLIPRCFSSSGRDLKDIVVLAVLLRQAVAMLDGIDILLSNGALHVAQLQIRALFEASVYIDWILLNDPAQKATYYYVHNLRRKRLWAWRMQPSQTQPQDFVAMMNKAGVPLRDEVKEIAKKQLKEIDRILSQPKFAAISSDIERHRKGKPFDPAWYVPLGERNLRTMSATVNKASLYFFLYSGASEVMHTSNYEHHVKIGSGVVTFQPIRSLEGFETLFRFTAVIAISTFRAILSEYRAGELPSFNKKYLEKWQKEFMNVPKINVKPEMSRI